jgi:hypothetical protein
MAKKIRDLIDLPPIRTVIQLSDTTDSQLKRLIGQSFVLTEEVYLHLVTILQALKEGQGEGFFILGNYGSGKSHFLSILSLLLQEEWIWRLLLQQKAELKKYYASIKANNYLVAADSLVEYQSWERLEDIILTKICRVLEQKYDVRLEFSGQNRFQEDLRLILKERYQAELTSFINRLGWTDEEPLFEPHNLPFLENLILELDLPYRIRPTRQQVFLQLEKLLNTGQLNGIVILLDEVSEFLRAKPTGRAFNEDIRFLQFLGEWANKHSLWIIATLQERIEDTGEIPQEVFNKIKDRYPRTIFLTAKHIEELIHQRLIRKKPGAAIIINEIYHEFKSAFSSWLIPQDRFYRLYPVNPQTLKFLEQVKSLFSQHRGIVDFIHYQLRGDPKRHIKGLWDEAPDVLLTPDKVFDHFLRRIKERVETNPYSEIVYRFYQESGENIFPDPEEYQLALKIIKVLILQAISPWEYHLNLKELTETLLPKITTWESEVNYQYVRDICERLYKQGSYINKKAGAKPQEDIYYVDLEADINLVIQRKVEYIVKGLEPEDSRLFYQLAPLVDGVQLPLAWLQQERRSKREIKWQNTPRWGYLILVDIREISSDFLSSLIDEFYTTEIDFILFLALPLQLREQQEYLLETILPFLQSYGIEDSAQQIPLLFWIPGPLALEDIKRLSQIYAHSILLEESRKDQSQFGQRIYHHLQNLVPDHYRVAKEIFIGVYYEGTLISNLTEQERSLREIGQLSFGRVLQEIIPPILDKRFPKHKQIAPYTDIFLRGTGQELISTFLRPGQISFPKGTSTNLKLLIEGYLRPLRIIKNIPNGFQLTVDPRKSPIVGHYLNLLGQEPVALDKVYWDLRKGPYGISQDQFHLLTLALIFSGQIIPYSGDKPKSLDEITTLELANISHLGPGELLSSIHQRFLKDITFIPDQLKKEPFTIQQQQTIWDFLKRFREEELSRLYRLREIINSAKPHPAFIYLDWPKIEEGVNKWAHFLEAINISLASKEGLERFVENYQQDAQIESSLDKYQENKNFFFNYLDKYLLIYRYLQERSWTIFPEEKYLAIAEQRQDLLERFKEIDKIFDETYLEGLFQAFDSFKETYIALYNEEHKKHCSPEQFLSYHQLRQSSDYQLLTLLAQIDSISVKNDLVKIERQLNKVGEYQCPGLEIQILSQQPFCSCGYQVGQERDLTPVSQLEDIIRNGIKEYILALQKEPEYQEKILDYIADLEVSGNQAMAEMLHKLLSLDIEDPGSKEELAVLLTPQMIGHINEALKGQPQTVLIRNLDELYENLVDRTFSKRAIGQIFNEWLSGAEVIDDRTKIKILSHQSKKT